MKDDPQIPELVREFNSFVWDESYASRHNLSKLSSNFEPFKFIILLTFKESHFTSNVFWHYIGATYFSL